MPEFADITIPSHLAELVIYDLQERLKHGSIEDELVNDAENLLRALMDCYRVTIYIKSE